MGSPPNDVTKDRKDWTARATSPAANFLNVATTRRRVWVASLFKSYRRSTIHRSPPGHFEVAKLKSTALTHVGASEWRVTLSPQWGHNPRTTPKTRATSRFEIAWLSSLNGDLSYVMNVAAERLAPSASVEVRTKQFDLVVLMLAAFALYSLNVDFTLYGDAGMYSDYVVLHKFDELTLHIGYFVSLFVANKLLGGLFGIPIQECAVWLNVVAGTLSVGIAYALARELLGNRRDALLCAVIFGLSGRVLNNATGSEMYMLQTLFVLSSFYLFVRERIVWSGLLCAAALLVSPLSAFAYLFYPVYDYQRAGRIRWNVLLRFAGAGLAIYLPFFIVDGREVLYGARGLLRIHRALPFRPLAMLANFPIDQFKAFTVLSLLLVPALYAWRENRRTFALALAVGIPHVYIILKLVGEDHVFILNTDFFFACCLVLGWRQLQNLKFARWIPPALLLAHVGLYIASGVIHSYQPHREYANEMRRVARTYLLGRDSVLITDWGRAVSLSFYGRPRPTTTVLMEPLFQNQIFDIEAPDPIQKLNRSEIYLLDAWHPSPLNEFLRSKESSAEFRRQHSVVSVAERDLHLQCTFIEETEYHRIYRCIQ